MTGEQQQLIQTPASVANIAFSPHGKTLAATTNQPDVAVRLWDRDSGKELPALAGNVGVSGDLAFSPDGNFLAAGRNDYNLTVWDLGRRQKVADIPPHRPARLAFSPDGQVLATLGTDGAVRLLHPGSGELLHRIELGCKSLFGWWQIAFAHDGRHLLLGNPTGTVYVLRLPSPS
jgi:WD40 repeat protein